MRGLCTCEGLGRPLLKKSTLEPEGLTLGTFLSTLNSKNNGKGSVAFIFIAFSIAWKGVGRGGAPNPLRKFKSPGPGLGIGDHRSPKGSCQWLLVLSSKPC